MRTEKAARSFKPALTGAAVMSLLCGITALTTRPASAQFYDPRMSMQLNAPYMDPHYNPTFFGTLEDGARDDDAPRARVAQVGTIVPTDIVPLPAPHEGQSFGQALQLRVLQRLPSKFYLNAINESSFRLETNPYQMPSKSALQQKLEAGVPTSALPQFRDQQEQTLLGEVNASDTVFRTLPNVTTGWAFTPTTRAYANYFLIRDSLMHDILLNNTVQSVGGGLQHDIALGTKANFQLNGQFRELYQSNQVPVFDYLPGATLSYALGRHSIAYINTLLQLRGRYFACAPTREIDPFYTVGVLTQRGRWQASLALTFLQNFRQPFAGNALIPVNNYSFVADAELDRQLFKKYSGMQAFIRAEPIWNFHSDNTPGLSGFDFRLFWGLRATLGKPPLTKAIQEIKQQLEGEEATPPRPIPSITPSTTGPTSYVPFRFN
jgi:hypothetical protein